MTRNGVLPLRRWLKRGETARLLAEFTALLPDVTLSLVEAGGSVFVTTEPPVAMSNVAEMTLPLQVAGETVGSLLVQGAGLLQPGTEAGVRFLHHGLTLLLARGEESRSLARETLERYREINLLYNIGETISASLDPEAIPHLVLAEAVRVISTDAGCVLLMDARGRLECRVGFGALESQEALTEIASSELLEVLEDRQPRTLTLAARPDQPEAIENLVCAPLKTRERVSGLIVLGRHGNQPFFTASDEKLLAALAGQAAVAIENARLFADVIQQRDAIAEIKNYMDNIFASIASGVITTDMSDLVTILNHAAEHILDINESEAVGQPYTLAFPEVGRQIAALMEAVKERKETVVGYEMQPTLPERGKISLRLNLSPLKDNHQQTTGVAIVVDDLTEQKQLEQQVRRVRQTFERYVPPQVVEQLLSNPENVQLGGTRQEVTILFADIRGFTAFGEKLPPEILVEALNQYLTLAAQAVLEQEGTLDKFIGDAVMALFNAPLPQPDHTLRAVRAAWNMQQAIAALHAQSPPDRQLSFGVGIVTGPSIVGNVGSPELHNYTAIGDSVNLAARLQSYARGGQVLLDVKAYEQVRDQIVARELGAVQVKGHSEPDLVFEVLQLRA